MCPHASRWPIPTFLLLSWLTRPVVVQIGVVDGGVMKKSEGQPHNPYWLRGLELARAADRCGARTRRGTACGSPAMPNGKCRIHGGKSPGAPRGERNGRWRGGFYSQEAEAERRRLRELIRQMR